MREKEQFRECHKVFRKLYVSFLAALLRCLHFLELCLISNSPGPSTVPGVAINVDTEAE